MDILRRMRVKEQSNRTLVEEGRIRVSSNVAEGVVGGHWAPREKVRRHHLYSITWPINGLMSLCITECQVQLCNFSEKFN